jgi:hypothetical protein
MQHLTQNVEQYSQLLTTYAQGEACWLSVFRAATRLPTMSRHGVGWLRPEVQQLCPSPRVLSGDTICTASICAC